MEEIEYKFKTQSKTIKHETLEKNHGRIETRICEVIKNLTELNHTEHWVNLKSIINITSIREINDKKTTEERFYISSLNQTPKYFNQATRKHWAVENNLHWYWMYNLMKMIVGNEKIMQPKILQL